MSITYGEIGEQYASMEKTRTYIEGCLPALCERLRTMSFKRIVVLGCGSSYSLAKSFAYMLNTRTAYPALAYPAGDIMLHADTCAGAFRDALVLAISRSGSTSEIMLAIEKLRENGAQFGVAAMTCHVDTPLAKLADLSLEMPWAFDSSVCQTRTVSCLYFAFAYTLARLTNDDALGSELQKVIAAGEKLLADTDAFALAYAPREWSKVVVLGDAELCGIAEEGALAYKEICQLTSNYYHLLDSRHGPAVLVDKDTLVIAALSSGGKYECDLIKEMAAKTSHIILVADEEAKIGDAVTVKCPEGIGQTARGLVLILLCQLLSYRKALLRGTDPDAPTGLDAWIAL